MVSFDLTGRTLIFPQTTIQLGNAKVTRRCLFDTGATFCHMTYKLWKQLGLNQILFDELSAATEFFKHIKSIKTANDFTFSNLPLTQTASNIGDGGDRPTYEFMIDSLELEGSPNMVFRNVTVRLIESKKSEFIIGMNIIKYLSTRYNPSIGNQLYTIALEKAGHDLYIHDQQNLINNKQTVHFKFLQAADLNIKSQVD